MALELRKVKGALVAVEKEAERRATGGPVDPRFDLALDVLGDLADTIAAAIAAQAKEKKP